MVKITNSELRTLVDFVPDSTWVVSLYLNVDGAKYPRVQDYEKELHGMITRAKSERMSGKTSARDKEKSLDRDLQAIEDFVVGQWTRNGTKGLAVFSCLEDEFWRVYELPTPVRSSLDVGSEVSAKTLVGVLEQHTRFCVVSVDRRKSRLFTFYLGALEERHGVKIDESVPDRVKAGEWAALRESKIARHIDDHVGRHLKETARRTYRLFVKSDSQYLILSGRPGIVRKFKEILHPYLQHKVAGELALDPEASLANFQEKSLEIEEEIRAREERELVHELQESSGPGGLAVLGLEETVWALMRGQAHTLVVSTGYLATGYVCYTDQYVRTVAGSCPVCGEDLSKSEDILESLVQLAVDQGVRVVQISRVPEFQAGEEIGALLRYVT